MQTCTIVSICQHSRSSVTFSLVRHHQPEADTQNQGCQDEANLVKCQKYQAPLFNGGRRVGVVQGGHALSLFPEAVLSLGLLGFVVMWEVSRGNETVVFVLFQGVFVLNYAFRWRHVGL